MCLRVDGLVRGEGEFGGIGIRGGSFWCLVQAQWREKDRERKIDT